MAQCPVLPCFEDSRATVEMALFGIDHEAQPYLVGHADTVSAQRVLCGSEIGIGDDQPGLEPGAVQCLVADGAQAAQFACPP